MKNNVFRKKFNDLGPNVSEKINDLFEGETKTPSEFVKKYESLSNKARKKAIKIAGAGLLSLLVLCGFNGCVENDNPTYAVEEQTNGEVSCPVKGFTHPTELTNIIYNKNDGIAIGTNFHKREYDLNFKNSESNYTTELIYIEPINKEYIKVAQWDYNGPKKIDEFNFYAYAKHNLNGVNYYSRTIFALYLPSEQLPDYLNDDVPIKPNAEITNKLIETYNEKPYSTFVDELNTALKTYKISIDYDGGKELSLASEFQDDLNKKASKKFAQFIDERYVSAQIINTSTGDMAIVKNGSNENNWTQSLVQTVVGVAYTKDGTAEIFHIQHRYKDPYSKYEDYNSVYNDMVAGKLKKDSETWKFIRIFTSPINESSYEINETAIQTQNNINNESEIER